MSRVNARNVKGSLINVLYVNKQEFSASSWRSNQGYSDGVWKEKVWGHIGEELKKKYDIYLTGIS